MTDKHQANVTKKETFREEDSHGKDSHFPCGLWKLRAKKTGRKSDLPPLRRPHPFWGSLRSLRSTQVGRLTLSPSQRGGTGQCLRWHPVRIS